ncbi:polysaccharide pyruvyl transferase family protein [Chelatococcus sp. SYSU_G07232]|uniref:Polysaccharide pyruvyl transferase family protein n=1 Tax=Chelatococcus albus TaxID=3047466 RepID=A0ABT7ACJ0_9HYPH|nr:polysaccharide pyruvyl transferase family protein [Chelatococcus sp. SYSU_G07232]MDJ1157086.1 polysaccharide pyruvyl transferase family protein [Chelatococcus sp. SYSU_G07232]
MSSRRTSVTAFFRRPFGVRTRQPDAHELARAERATGTHPGHPAALGPHVALFGNFGTGNLGNDGSLEAMLIALRELRPDLRLTCICPGPERVREDHHLRALPMDWPRPDRGLVHLVNKALGKLPGKLVDLVQTLRQTKGIDALVVPGTGLLDDTGERPSGIPYALFRACFAARIRGAKVAFVSVGAGSIRHPLSRWLLKRAIGLAHYRSFRDTLSKECLARIGCTCDADPVYPDIAFRLPSPPHGARREGAPLTVGLGVMAYGGWRDEAESRAIYRTYVGKLVQFVLWLLDRGHRVRLLMGETRDQRAVDDLVAAVTAKRPVLAAAWLEAEPARSLHELMRQIAETDIVVATRFHNIICALKLGRPTVSLGYSPRHDALMEDMGLGAFCQHVETFDVAALVDQFARLLARRGDCERCLAERNRAYEEQLRRQDGLLAATLFALPEKAASSRQGQRSASCSRHRK